jgi:hypothetical protein
MKKVIKSKVLLAAMACTFFAIPAQAFNPATHLYIADNVFPYCGNKIDLYYGSFAPDLALYVANLEVNWSTAFEDTHYTYMDLRSDAFGSTQKAFAKGWLTHNEAWGADHWAHIEYLDKGGYVIEKAGELLNSFSFLDDDFAHYAIEVAIDLLLKNNHDHKLGAKLLVANWLRSWQDRYLLAKVLVWQQPARTDWLTLVTAEFTLRSIVHRYAMALALPSPNDQQALVELGVQLAKELYDIEVTATEVEEILEAAKDLCEIDYMEVIAFSVAKIKEQLP